ncbi:MAG: HAD family phosphatase [candidate division KSB1 bacterium]|jgi:putative hydrolase of the HAD superfamily|nr:HAD family phosphatase [candidate division KSB1 bacterium]
MIQTVIFDLGGVLVEIDSQKFLNNVSREFNVPQETLAHSANGQVHQEFMKGNLTGEQFHSIICQKYNHTVGIDKFINIWNTILIRQSEAVAGIVQELQSQCALALLSNIDPWHYRYCTENYPVLDLFEDKFLSYEMHLVKPEQEIYLRVVDKLKVQAEECLFIDDLEENISAAKQAGLHAIQFRDVVQLRKDLRKSGLLSH